MTVLLTDASCESERGDQLREQLLAGKDFWETVAAPFLKRDVSRADVRDVMIWALDSTSGDLMPALKLLNIPETEENGKKLYKFLQRYKLVHTVH